MGRINLLLVMALVAIGIPAAQADTLYKWVDSQGRISYHDQPPPDGAGYRVEEKVLGTGNKHKEDDTLAKVVEKYPVVLYSVPACGSCDLARAYLQKRKVPFTEQNLDNNPELQQTLKKKIGSLSAPTLMIGEKVMKGYVESVLEGELDGVGYPKIEAAEPSANEGQGNDKAPAPSDSGYRPTRRY
ncbi:glutaredoxin domain-containing protein [Sulfuricaulis sp.]|jgi:glutaredoxin|uniref:glutaredoxin domain-containing protein n=1 Tax=Sulfuricaulis sp. TaxID=2003553 RepID=UPI003559A951